MLENNLDSFEVEQNEARNKGLIEDLDKGASYQKKFEFLLTKEV